MDEIIESKQTDIKSLILNIRDTQVLLDSDVAMLYGYETKQINQAVNRNKERFPENFRFQLTKEEVMHINFSRLQIATLKSSETKDVSRSQSVTLKRGQNIKYLPYAFTEQGIAMLSGLLKSDIAVQVSIGIMEAFVEMRRFISTYGKAFERISTIEYKMLGYDKKFEELFELIQGPQEFSQGIFHKGQIYDAFKLIMDIIRSAEKSIIIIDNYADDSVLDMLADKKPNVTVSIVTGKPSYISMLVFNKFTAQYPELKVIKSDDFHDRFIIIDDSKLYHIGASLKDAGKKCFAISIMDSQEILNSIIATIKDKKFALNDN